ncbi:hypothetical protein IWX90DRAFT_489033 [Phyllosticta citrichinensis]|uniref:Uncharacterized protein n=1 Tax=Phyllosticta citrichinensis TaxID=1130410 RepID=A0ABR1XLS3_9PEZI
MSTLTIDYKLPSRSYIIPPSLNHSSSMEGEKREQRKPPPRPRTPPHPRGFRRDRALSVINYSVQSTVSGNSRLPLQRGPPSAKQLVLAHIRQEHAQAGEQRRQEPQRNVGRGRRSVDNDGVAVAAQMRQAAAAADNVVAETSTVMNGTSDDGASGRQSRPSHLRTGGRKLQRARLTSPTGLPERGRKEKERTRDEGAGTSCSSDGDENFQDELEAIDQVARLYGDLSEISDAELGYFDELV